MQHRGWKIHDIVWVLGLYGTTVGAGTLFLPVEIGTRGPVIFFAMLLLALPLSVLPHRLLCRVYMADKSSSSSASMFGQFFDKKGELFLTLLYFLAFYPVVLIYGISLVNAIDSYLTLHMHLPALNRGLLSFLCMAVLFGILSKGRDKVVRTMSVLALPFALAIMTIAVALIPQWNTTHFAQQFHQVSHKGFTASLKEFWLSLPLITFSFGCAPIILPLTSYYQQKKTQGEYQALKIIKMAYAAIFISILFFVFSFVASLPQQDFEQAKRENLSVLSVMTSDGGFSLIYTFAPFIAMIGMTKSFLGVSLSVTETFAQLAAMLSPKNDARNVMPPRALVMMFLYLFTWFVVYINPNVITLIETLCGPLIAVMIYLVPAYIVYRFDAFRTMRCKKTLFIAFSGLVTLSALIYSLI